MVGWIVCGMKDVKDGTHCGALSAGSQLTCERSFSRRHLSPHALAHAAARILQAAQVDGIRWNLPLGARRVPEAGGGGSKGAPPTVATSLASADTSPPVAYLDRSLGVFKPRELVFPRSGVPIRLQWQPAHGCLPTAPGGRVRRGGHCHSPVGTGEACAFTFSLWPAWLIDLEMQWSIRMELSEPSTTRPTFRSQPSCSRWPRSWSR